MNEKDCVLLVEALRRALSDARGYEQGQRHTLCTQGVEAAIWRVAQSLENAKAPGFRRDAFINGCKG